MKYNVFEKICLFKGIQEKYTLFGRFQQALKFDKKRIEKRPFDYAQGDECYVISTAVEKSQPLKGILKEETIWKKATIRRYLRFCR